MYACYQFWVSDHFLGIPSPTVCFSSESVRRGIPLSPVECEILVGRLLLLDLPCCFALPELSGGGRGRGKGSRGCPVVEHVPAPSVRAQGQATPSPSPSAIPNGWVDIPRQLQPQPSQNPKAGATVNAHAISSATCRHHHHRGHYDCFHLFTSSAESQIYNIAIVGLSGVTSQLLIRIRM